MIIEMMSAMINFSHNICSQLADPEVSELPEDITSWLSMNSRHVDYETASRLLQLHDELTGYFGSLYPYYLHIFSTMSNLCKVIELGYSDDTILANVFFHNDINLENGIFSSDGRFINLVKLLNQNYIIRL